MRSSANLTRSMLTLNQSCKHCPSCLEGYRQYCAQARGFAYHDLDQGAFGDYRIIDADFAYPIPDSIPSLHVGPLMCAGASVYEALHAAGTRPSDRVGVVGLGGLGSMAIIFANAMGCAVTAISGSGASGTDKVDSVFELGADEFRTAKEPNVALRRKDPSKDATHPVLKDETLAQNINVLLICANGIPDLATLFPLLARRAVIVFMTIQEQPLVIPYMPFILPGHKVRSEVRERIELMHHQIIASTESSRRNTINMLAFVARHRIVPPIERFPMTADGLAEAFERLESGKMRYRGVFEAP